MRKHQLPPIKLPLVDKKGQINRSWLRWMQDLSRASDDQRRTPDVVYAASATLNTDDFGKLHLFNTGSSDLVCTLMTASSADKDGWLTIVRTGTGRLTIIPDAAAKIESGLLGGRIWCEEPKRVAANMTLQLITATQWAITSAMGIWIVR